MDKEYVQITNMNNRTVGTSSHLLLWSSLTGLEGCDRVNRGKLPRYELPLKEVAINDSHDH